MDRSVVCRFHAVRLDNVGKRRFDHFDFHALSDFHVYIIVIDPNHLTHKTAARDDLVALLHGFDSGAMLLHFLLLRTNEKKVERSEEHTSELQSLMRISYAVFCLKKKNNYHSTTILFWLLQTHQTYIYACVNYYLSQYTILYIHNILDNNLHNIHKFY